MPERTAWLRLFCIVFAIALPLGSAVAAESASSDQTKLDTSLPGKAKLDTVVPKGPMNPHSGAPASWDEPINDEAIHHFFLLDRGEYRLKDGTNDYLWEGIGWIGGDYNKLWLKTEGDGLANGDSPEDAEIQVKYGRAIAPYFSAQVGIRYDIYPNPSRTFAVFNLQGFAQYRFDVENQLYVSEDGDVSFEGEYEYNLRLTQRLILQPRFEFNVAASDAPREFNQASGLRSTQMGLRLRYEFVREFAPYIGVRYDRDYGDTRDLVQDAGGDTTSTAFVIGLRAWY